MNQIKLSFLCAVLAFCDRYLGFKTTGIYAATAGDDGTIARCVTAAATFFDANATAAAALTELQLLSAARDFVVQFTQKNAATPLAVTTVTRNAAVSTAIATFIATLT